MFINFLITTIVVILVIGIIIPFAIVLNFQNFYTDFPEERIKEDEAQYKAIIEYNKKNKRK